MSGHLHRRADVELMSTANRPPDEVTVLQVIAVQYRLGEGCCGVDPVRQATAYYSMDGELLAVRVLGEPAYRWQNGQES